MRGDITDEIKQKSAELFGYEINQTELRLMPYVDYRLKNDGNIERDRVNKTEKAILAKWEEMGFIKSPLIAFRVSREFYNAMQEILRISYVETVGRIYE